MKNKVFIIFNSVSILIKGSNIDKKFNIKITDYEKTKELFRVCDFISSHLLKYEESYDIILILGENFFCVELNDKNYISPYIEGKHISSEKNQLYFDKYIIDTMIAYFSKGNNNVLSVLPMLFFVENYYEKENDLIITLQTTNSFITVLNVDYEVIHHVKLPLGTDNICKNLSNVFNISLEYSRTIVRKCNYAYIPEELVDYSIDIPISKDYIKTLELSELSLQIRRSLYEIFENIFFHINRFTKQSNLEFNYIINSDTCINGLSRYLYNNINEDVTLLKFGTNEFEYFIDKYININKKFKSLKEEIVSAKEEVGCIEQENLIIKPNFKNKLTDKVNILLNGFLTAISE